MLIPVDSLNKDTLEALIEEFITREGTDYGEYEIELKDKVQQVYQQLLSNENVIVFDAATESANIMTQQQYREFVASS